MKKCECCKKKIQKDYFYLADNGQIVCFICYIDLSKIA